MSVEKEIRKILAEGVPAASRAKQDLVRSGLGHNKNASAVMKALENPEESMKNPAKREMLLKVMQDLLDVVVNDQSMMSKTKTALRKEEVEEIEEKLVGGQKKIDVNKNGKLDAEDFKKLRMKKEEEEKAEQMIEAKKSKKDEEDDEEENEKEDEDEKEEDDEDEKDMTNPRKNFKGFKKGMKADEGFVSHAQRKAVWASRNDEKEAIKRKAKKTAKEEVQLEQAPVAPAPVKHRIAVTISEPDHPMVTKRKEQILKHVVVSHGPDKAGAQKVGEKFYKKKGYKVHGSEHAGLKEEVSESDNKMQYAVKHKLSKKILSTHKDLASAKDEWKGIDKNERPFYQVVSHSKPAKSFSMKESVTTDYSKIAGQSQNKTPTQKLATDYKLATKKTQKEEVEIDEATNRPQPNLPSMSSDQSVANAQNAVQREKKRLELLKAKDKTSNYETQQRKKTAPIVNDDGSFTMKKEEVEQLDELSPATKASYVAKAKDQIKQSIPYTKKGEEYRDIAKNFIKKREKGIAKANEARDPREYDYEGDMAKSQLRSIMANAKQAHDMLKDDTNMAEWVQSKITLAADYISTVADYMQSEVNEDKNDYQRKIEKNDKNFIAASKRQKNPLTNVHTAQTKMKPVKESFRPMDEPNYNNSIQARQKKADDARQALKKTKMKPVKEKEQVDEAFPTVDDAKKRMKDALKSKFDKKKISTGTVYTKKHKEEPEDEKKSDK